MFMSVWSIIELSIIQKIIKSSLKWKKIVIKHDIKYGLWILNIVWVKYVMIINCKRPSFNIFDILLQRIHPQLLKENNKNGQSLYPLQPVCQQITCVTTINLSFARQYHWILIPAPKNNNNETVFCPHGKLIWSISFLGWEEVH